MSAQGGMSEAILRDFERRGAGVVRRRAKPGGQGGDASSSDRRGKGKERGGGAGRQGAGAARGPPAATAAAGPEIDPATLSEEQKLALKRWRALTDEQRRDLLAKYGHARAEARQRKMEAAYRPKTRQSPATDYDKWDAWARNLPPEDTSVNGGAEGNSAQIVGETASTAAGNVLTTLRGKIEAFSASFLFALLVAQLVLPLEMRFTLTKQLLFGVAVLCCLWADRHGRALEWFGFMWGSSVGVILFAAVKQSAGVGMLVGGLVGASNRG